MSNGTFNINFVATLNNDSLWKKHDNIGAVTAIGLEMGPCFEDDGEAWGELRVVFATSTWDVERDGLLYTDTGFLEAVIAQLEELGLPTDEVGYSEQGMQGENYVSFDVGNDFIRAWKLTPVNIEVLDDLNAF